MFVANAVMYKVDDMLGEGMSRCSCPFDVIVASNIYPAIPWAAERERERERERRGERERGERERGGEREGGERGGREGGREGGEKEREREVTCI